MTDSTDYQQFSKQFMEQWQRQMSRMTSDHELIRALLEMVQNPVFSAMTQHDEGKQRTTSEDESAGAEDASGAGDATVAELTRRIAYCEARISRLEELLNGTAQSPSKRSGKRSTSATASRKRSAKKDGSATTGG